MFYRDYHQGDIQIYGTIKDFNISPINIGLKNVAAAIPKYYFNHKSRKLNTFIITFRESLEASLIIGIIYTILHRKQLSV